MLLNKTLNPKLLLKGGQSFRGAQCAGQLPAGDVFDWRNANLGSDEKGVLAQQGPPLVRGSSWTIQSLEW